MDKESAVAKIKDVLEKPFDKKRYISFVANLLKNIAESPFEYSGTYINESFRQYIRKYERIGKYIVDGKRIDILIVYLNKETSIERARTMQRNFVAGYLTGKYGSDTDKDAAVVAFVSPGLDDWRFSLVKMEYRLAQTKTGKPKGEQEFTPAKRWSFLVGANEKSHTAQRQLVGILQDDKNNPTLERIEEAFNIETVTKEFFTKYRDLFIRTKKTLDDVVSKDQKIKKEFEDKAINTVDFSKKLLGQIIFLYFLQKKGWFGVKRNKEWGSGSKNFLRELFDKKHCSYNNFFNDILEPLFYEALSKKRDDNYYSRFDCKIPFLNGGLFDPINGYDWVNTEITLKDELFSNQNRTNEGDIGDGIFDVFDRYNFTVREDEPLEKEVAIDPELLGKAYEKFNAIRPDNFDEYINSIKTGKESQFNKEYGVYYTPREIVHFICQKGLECYLKEELKEIIPEKDIEDFIQKADSVLENELAYKKKSKQIENGEIKKTSYTSELASSILQNLETIDKKLEEVTICDPAVGSGAFPVGMMSEIIKLRSAIHILLTGNIPLTYEMKKTCLEKSIYGVDIDEGAIEIARLRMWLSLIVDEEDIKNIKPLPNLDYKLVKGDSLIGLPYEPEWYGEVEKKKLQYLEESDTTKKAELKREVDSKLEKQLKSSSSSYGYKIDFDFKLFFSEVFHQKGGFDIVIGNPPYISTKGVSENDKKILERQFGFADDLYNHFYFKGVELLKESGILSFISSKTFWTIQTKKNLRNLILKNKLLLLFDTGNPFDAPMVDTCVILIQKCANPPENYLFGYLDGTKNIDNPEIKTESIEYYKNAPNQVFFPINEYNIKIYKRYREKVKKLLEEWWDKISTSKNIEKNKKRLEEYRNSLKPGDITLLGLITEGGVGIQTGNNGKYIGVLEGTKWADNVKKQRPEKLLLAQKFCKEKLINNKNDANKFLNTLSETEIRNLFDELKEKYGRDIFGQGWLYRIVSPTEIADVDSLTDDEKLNGIEGKRTFVPYDKGDKDGNRWYAPTPYYIDWNRENVKFLKENSGKKGEGMPVVRNPKFYFREGFCWTDVNSTYLKSRIKEIGVYDVLTMSLFTATYLPDLLFVCLINSSLLSEYVDIFVNSTSHFQINDARQLPIIIPNVVQLQYFENIFNRAVAIQKDKFSKKISEKEAEKELDKIQKELDNYVEEMYLC